jgi:hypothetical protein
MSLVFRLTAIALLTSAAAFAPTTTKARPTSSTLDAFKRHDGESEKEYFRRVTAAASNPEAFERMALENEDAVEPILMNNATSAAEVGSKRKGYVRAEEWEEEEQRKRKEMRWEERVQFDGQQHGNRFNQNEILRHHLNAF